MHDLVWVQPHAGVRLQGLGARPSTLLHARAGAALRPPCSSLNTPCPYSQLDSLVVDGKPSRFCQQCGRFHPIDEFEGNRRSCRAV